MNAFMDGAREVNPDVKFLVSFINSWYDPPKAKEAAFAMIDRGAGRDVRRALRRLGRGRERKVKVIGNVIDTSKDYPDTVLASALWHMEPDDRPRHQAVMEGRFQAEDYGPYSYMPMAGRASHGREARRA
jgi:basic membrane lipoprotein Med (substrate-binding protein (PBP1-ABC) superfamily)